MKATWILTLPVVTAALIVTIVTTGTVRAQWGYDVIEFDEAELFFEENTTDGDMGLHLKVDGEGWRKMFLVTPQGRRLLDIKVRGSLGQEIGLTELFSESAEPGYDEMPREEFLELFEEGDYRFYGFTLEGDWLVAYPELTKNIPGAPEILSPEEEAEVDPEEDLVIEWAPLDDPNPPESSIEFYEVVCEKDEDEERLRVFTVHMLPTDTNVRVPAEFLEAGKAYKVEIVAQETSGNRAAAEVEFETEGEEEEEEEEEEE
ncbi:MAG: hypothetical protein QGI24_06095 [Kiritimatiellia bacterium]|jgi:hypothetical protein|nr:hypothetical protein [Kiritimatiellia bacterium]MDP6848340.1 hypothetical protein [Kiritimatiellia bacterium]